MNASTLQPPRLFHTQVWRLLGLPWRVLARSNRWLMVIVLLLDAGLASLSGVLGVPHPLRVSALMLAIGTGVIWFYLMPQTLALQKAARTLCLPHAQREVQLSLFKYAMLTLLLPTSILAMCGAPFLTTLLALMLAAATGWIVALLPSYGYYLLLLAYFGVLALGQMLPDRLEGLLPAPSSSEFTILLAWLDPFLLLLAVGRWLQLSRATLPQSRLRRPIVFNLSPALGGRCHTTSLVPDESELLKHRPHWLQPTLALGNTGPGRVDLALRVALGAGWLPVAASTRIRQVLMVTALLAVVGLFLLLVGATAHNHLIWSFFRQAGGWLALFGGLLGCMSHAAVLRQHWSRVNTELPLLALLPGLGNARSVKHHLLKVCFMHALKSWLFIGISSWLLLAWATGGFAWWFSGAVLWVCMFGLSLNCSQWMVLFGQLHWSWPRKWLLNGWLLLTCLGSLGYGLWAFLSASAWSGPWVALLAGAWLLLLVPVVRDCVLGWRRLQRLPHVFLPANP